MANRFRSQTGFEPFAAIDVIPAEGRPWGYSRGPACGDECCGERAGGEDEGFIAKSILEALSARHDVAKPL
jgi:hypothetical protein